MKYPTVSVNGVSVRVDDYGRYNLNDLHAAAVAEGKAKSGPGVPQNKASKTVCSGPERCKNGINHQR
jgi:hypothetical protein